LERSTRSSKRRLFWANAKAIVAVEDEGEGGASKIKD
jgi:hypothetical protein